MRVYDYRADREWRADAGVEVSDALIEAVTSGTDDERFSVSAGFGSSGPHAVATVWVDTDDIGAALDVRQRLLAGRFGESPGDGLRLRLSDGLMIHGVGQWDGWTDAHRVVADAARSCHSVNIDERQFGCQVASLADVETVTAAALRSEIVERLV